MKQVFCPLCASRFVEYTIESNNVPRYHQWTREIVGFDAGKPSLNAKCARGCSIRVEASQPLPAQEPKKFDPELCEITFNGHVLKPMRRGERRLEAPFQIEDPGPSKYDREPVESEE